MGTTGKTINILYLISFMDLFSVGLTFPVLAPYIRSLDVSHFTVGLLSSAYAALQVLSGPAVGAWSDVRGRKSVFIITLVASSLCYFCLGLCKSLFAIFFLRLILGIFKHTQTLTKAITADIVHGSDGARVYGRSMAFASLGFVVGPLLGGHLFELNNGFTYICTLTALLFVINAGLVWKLPVNASKEEITKDHLKKSSIFINIKDEIRKTLSELQQINWTIHWVSFMLKFLLVLTTTIFFVNQVLYLKEKHKLPQRYIGYIISLISVVGVITSFFSNSITLRFYKPSTSGHLKRSLHCFLALLISYLIFFYTSNIYILSLTLLPYGISSALLRLVTMEIMLDNCGPNERGTVTGASDSVMSLARFVAPMSAGLMGDYFGGEGVIVYAMLPCIIGVLVCWAQKHKCDKMMVELDKVK